MYNPLITNDQIHPDSLIIPLNTVETVRPADLRPGDIAFRLGEHKGRTTLTRAVVHHRSETGAVYTAENGIIASPSDSQVYRIPAESDQAEQMKQPTDDQDTTTTTAPQVRAKTRPPVIGFRSGL